MTGVGGLGGLYSRALDGLIVSQKGMTVTSNNIANVNTPGYARQQFVQGSRAVFGGGTNGGGVLGLGVTSLINPFVERQLIDEKSNFGFYDGRRLTMSFLEDVVSEANGDGVGSAITEFFNSWSELQADPSNGSLRSTVRESGRLVADRINSLNNSLQDMRSSTGENINAQISQINSVLEEIADYNAAILRTSDEAAKTELITQRTVAIQELSEEIGVNFFEDENRVVNIQIAGSGFPLVNGDNASTLAGANSVVSGGLYTVTATIPGSSGATTIDVTSDITNGRLGGNLEDRNTTINNAISDLDNLAYQLSLQINSVHQNGYGLDGVDSRDFFAPMAGVDGAAAAMSLDAAIENDLDAIAAAGDDPAVTGVGDSDNIAALVNLQNTAFLNGNTETFGEFISSFRTGIGIEAAQTNSGYESSAGLVSRLELQRENVSGVNLDEEAVDLIKYQRAFEGSARVMQAANAVFDILLDL